MDDFEDAWEAANPQLKGPWSERLRRQQKPCVHCNQPAIMNEPGTGRKAHKACSLGWTSTPPVTAWDGEDRKPIEDQPYGCGKDGSPVLAGRRCSGIGDQLTCQLCPKSPGYWRKAEQ